MRYDGGYHILSCVRKVRANDLCNRRVAQALERDGLQTEFAKLRGFVASRDHECEALVGKKTQSLRDDAFAFLIDPLHVVDGQQYRVVDQQPLEQSVKRFFDGIFAGVTLRKARDVAFGTVS